MSPGDFLKPIVDLFSDLRSIAIIIVILIGAMIVLPIVAAIIHSMGSSADPDIIKWLLKTALDFIMKNPLIDAVVLVFVVIIAFIKGRSR